jgi:hypothetical protein
MLIHPPDGATATQVGLIAADAGVARGPSGDRVELLAAQAAFLAPYRDGRGAQSQEA